MDHMVKLPTVLESSLTSLSAEQRDTYTAVIDDIITKNGGGVISGEQVFRLFRERASTSLALLRQRHLLKMLIIQRLKKLPTPRTVTTTYTGRGYMALRVIKTASAVFDVPELLEAILSHVNMADLIAARRVNKALFRLIETSPALQRKLFLLPGNIPPGHLGWACNGSPAEVFTPPGRPSSKTKITWGSSDIIVDRNPFLLATAYTDMWDCYSSPDGQSPLEPLDLLVCAHIKTQMFDSNLWPEMYLTSPPCTGVAFSFTYTEEYLGSHITRFYIHRSVYDPTGVTFATVWDALHKEGEMRIWRNCKPLSEESYGSEEVLNTTVREQIDLHRSKGIKVSLNRDRSSLESFSVAVLAADTEADEINHHDNGGWPRDSREQEIEW